MNSRLSTNICSFDYKIKPRLKYRDLFHLKNHVAFPPPTDGCRASGGAAGRNIPPFAARPRIGDRPGLRRGHRRPVGDGWRGAGDGPGAAAGGDARDGEPDLAAAATGRLREHQTIPGDFPDRQRPQAGRGIEAAAPNRGGVFAFHRHFRKGGGTGRRGHRTPCQPGDAGGV